MDNQDFYIKIGVLAAYVGVLFLIGILASRRIKDMSDYYVGGKKMKFWAVAFSARATGESGWLLIGLTGIHYLLESWLLEPNKLREKCQQVSSLPSGMHETLFRNKMKALLLKCWAPQTVQ